MVNRTFGVGKKTKRARKSPVSQIKRLDREVGDMVIDASTEKALLTEAHTFLHCMK